MKQNTIAYKKCDCRFTIDLLGNKKLVTKNVIKKIQRGQYSRWVCAHGHYTRKGIKVESKTLFFAEQFAICSGENTREWINRTINSIK